jgi:DNA-binding PadR family transcriptional regulator
VSSWELLTLGKLDSPAAIYYLLRKLRKTAMLEKELMVSSTRRKTNRQMK